MIVSILDWTMDRFQDALLTEELDPGLFVGRAKWARRKKRASSSSWIFAASDWDGVETDDMVEHSARESTPECYDAVAKFAAIVEN